MDSMVEENGNAVLDPLVPPPQQHVGSVSPQPQQATSTAVLATSTANLVTFIPAQNMQDDFYHKKLPAYPDRYPKFEHTVTQANQSSVIQTAANLHPVLNKGVLYVNKGNSVIHTTPGIQQRNHNDDTATSVSQNSKTYPYYPLAIKPEPITTPHPMNQIVNDTNSDDDSFSDDDSPKRRRDLLTRRPSYHRILKDITATDIAVLPTTALQIANVQGADGLHAIQSGNVGIVQYATQGQDGQFYVPAEDQSRKREIRLQKNREAARECRRKKKEYIKCLENRVAVLENQNKALIEELKSLKELYCQSKQES